MDFGSVSSFRNGEHALLSFGSYVDLDEQLEIVPAGGMLRRL